MKKIIYAVAVVSPVFALGATTPDTSGISGLVRNIGGIINSIIPILFALAIIYFFWGLITFIRGQGDPEKSKTGKSIMIYGVIAIAVMASIYGLIAWLQNTLGVSSGTIIDLPHIPGGTQ